MRTATLLVLACCASRAPTLPSVRFANAPAPDAVNDRRDVPHKPHNRQFVRYLYHFDGSFHRLLTRTLELPSPQRARGINALDEVPDSTWFTNRIGRRAVSPEEVFDAPGGVGSPEPYRPWTVVSSKPGGASVGFVVRDARGEKFLLKFDRPTFPEAETGIHIIVAKLLWAAGYNVSDDYIVYFRKEDLVLAPDAVIRNGSGYERPFERDDLEDRLSRIHIAADGRIRALASHWLPGKAIGSHAPEGVRTDDPNDRIPHELRRDLRGAFSIWSWLDHVDIQGTQFLDVWVEDPRDRRRHYVKHYMLDFGQSLGFLATTETDRRRAIEYYWDWDAVFRSMITLGLSERPWEDRPTTGPRGWEMFDVASYDPGAWKPSTPVYLPLRTADRIDKFWGAKIVIRFTPEQIRAAIDAAKLTDPRIVDFLVETLVARQRKTAKYWFDRVNPLDEFTASGDSLCFADLAIRHALAPSAATRYTLSLYDFNARPLGKPAVIGAGAGGESCAALALGQSGYTIVRVDTARPGFTGTTYVHVARDRLSREPRVIGIWRP